MYTYTIVGRANFFFLQLGLLRDADPFEGQELHVKRKEGAALLFLSEEAYISVAPMFEEKGRLLGVAALLVAFFSFCFCLLTCLFLETASSKSRIGRGFSHRNMHISCS